MSDARESARAYAAEAQRMRDAGDHYGALLHQRRAVALLRSGEDRAALAHAIRHVADILVECGRPDEAAKSIAEMLGLYRAAADAPPLDVANALRSAAVHAEALGDDETARSFWIEARGRYAALDTLFEALTGAPGNPGVAEADRHLARL